MGARSGAAPAWSCATLAPDWYSAHWMGFSLSMPAQGMPAMARACAGSAVCCGQTYMAMAMPAFMTVMTSRQAISRNRDGKVRRMRTV